MTARQLIPWVDEELDRWGSWVRSEPLPGRCETLLGRLIRRRAQELGLPTQGTDDWLYTEDRAVWLDQEIARLPSILRRVAKHRYIKRRTREDIAVRLRVCPRTVHTYTVRLHHMLRVEFEKKHQL